MSVESVYEYGSRAGFWRVWRLFTGRGVPLTVFGVATALARNPEAVATMHEAEWEIAGHGLKWIDYAHFAREEEARHMDEAIRLHEEITGERPLGWYTGRTSVHTLDLAMERGFTWLADSYADDCPTGSRDRESRNSSCPIRWRPTTCASSQRRASIPVTGSSRSCAMPSTCSTQAPKMLSVDLHCRLVGRPGRIAALARFLDHVAAHEGVWCARRIDIARHWIAEHPPT